jgi:oligosaccharyl transferase (archaeosortase A-associated)
VRKFDLAALGLILFVAAALRLWAPWGDVFPSTALGASGATRVNFLETDAWYHVRLVENQVRNFPHHVTVDPYAAPGGQFVAVAPLLDAVIATVVFVTRGPGAPTAYIERVAALAPPIMGVLAVVAIWALATVAFDRRAGLMAAFLAAILPGHFLDRTLVGFVDHHALEVLLSFATLAALAWAIRPALSDSGSRASGARGVEGSPEPGARSPAGIAGLCLGLYLLAWSSGAFFVAILAFWVVLIPFIGESKAAAAAGRAVLIAAAVALVMVLMLQSPAMFRYNTQVASLVGLLVLSAIVLLLARTNLVFRSALSASSVALVFLSVASVALLIAYVWTPALVRQVAIDFSRFRPDLTRMAVLEARPLFLYTGNWTWLQPWTFFRSGFYLGALAVMVLAATLWRSRRLDHLLIVIFTAAAFIATVGQNRFGYYLVPATAVVIGWLSVRVLDWGGVPHAGNPKPQVNAVMPLQREAAVVLVAGLAIAPNLVPAALTTTRAGGMADYWANAMTWLRSSTPEPFGSDALYTGRYGKTNPAASYTVMNWWDQGYWIVQSGHRVPVSNPTQVRAPNAAAFYTATDENAALNMLAADRVRYVLVDWELPFREDRAGTLAGRFQNLADWAGIPTSRFYSLCYTHSREGEPWQPIWLFHEPYYQSMVYRLMVAGGRLAVPADNTYVVTVRDRVDDSGRQFCEVSGRQVFPTPAAAKAAAEKMGAGARAVGLSPWQPAFVVPAVTGLRIAQEFRGAGQKPGESPMIRVFEAVK